MFLLFGIGFSIQLGYALLQDARVRGWERVPCTILTSRVIDRDSDEDPYAFDVRYRYEISGRSWVGEKYRRNETFFSDYADAQRLVEKYRSDSAATCLVNPADPGDAVLEATPLGYGAFLLLPMVFIVIGGGGIYFTLRPHSASPSSSSIRGKRHLGPLGAAALFSVFLFAGIGVSFATTPMLLEYFDSRTWVPTPARVESSRVQSNTDSDGTTYRVDILYKYEFDGREYGSNRYGFFNASSSGYAGKEAIVRQHAPGKRVECYVDPDDPTRAVLHRGWSWELLFGLFPLPFITVGLLGVIASLRRWQREKDGQPMSSFPPPPRGRQAVAQWQNAAKARQVAQTAGPVVLKPTMSPVLKLILIGFFALLWNGIMIGAGIGTSREGVPGLVTCFMIPFYLVGLGLIGAVVYTALGLANPRPTITLADGRLALGSALDVSWTFSGKVERISQLKITLEGRESATYRRGTDTTTDRRTFERHVLLDSGNPMEIRSGRAQTVIPAETMHSFSASDNKIEWHIVVHGVIDNWPDVKEEYLVQIEPLEMTGRGS
jgi:hypothetical protein